MSLDMIAGAAGAWLWEQFGKDIISRLTGDIEGRWKNFLKEHKWAGARDAYRKALIRDHSTIRIIGRSGPVDLEHLFTDVYLLDRVSALEYHDINSLISAPPNRFRRYLNEGQRIHGLELVRKPESFKFFIFGKPGAGKTTFLRFLILQSVKGVLDKVPVYVDLQDWSTRNVSLLEYLAIQFDICQFPEPELFIKYLLENGKALVLLDGLDEVNQSGDLRARITTEIESFTRKYYHNQYIVTCRIGATERAFHQFQDAEIADFTDEQTRIFIDKWFSDSDDPKKEQKHEAFIRQFYARENTGVRELGNVPILLTLICLAFENTMNLPKRRAELYQDALDILLRKWDAFRGKEREEIYKGLSLLDKQRLFASIAAQTFEKGQQYFDSRWLADEIQGFIARLPMQHERHTTDGTVILKSIETQHGVLFEQAKNIYSFSHLTFQEYYAARYIASNEARGTVQNLVLKHSFDSRWREVFLITATLLSEADDFLLLFQLSIDKLVESDNMLNEILMWVDQQALSGDPITRLSERFNNLAWFCASEVATVYNNAYLDARDLARDLGDPDETGKDVWRYILQDLRNNLTVARELDLVGVRVRDLVDAESRGRAVVRARELGRALDQDFGFIIARVNANELARNLDTSQARSSARDFARVLGQATTRASKLARSLDRDGRLAQARAKSSLSNIKFSSDQVLNLYRYLKATSLFQDCLDLSVALDRSKIISNILTSPILRNRRSLRGAI